MSVPLADKSLDVVEPNPTGKAMTRAWDIFKRGMDSTRPDPNLTIDGQPVARKATFVEALQKIAANTITGASKEFEALRSDIGSSISDNLTSAGNSISSAWQSLGESTGFIEPKTVTDLKDASSTIEVTSNLCVAPANIALDTTSISAKITSWADYAVSAKDKILATMGQIPAGPNDFTVADALNKINTFGSETIKSITGVGDYKLTDLLGSTVNSQLTAKLSGETSILNDLLSNPLTTQFQLDAQAAKVDQAFAEHNAARLLEEDNYRKMLVAELTLQQLQENSEKIRNLEDIATTDPSQQIVVDAFKASLNSTHTSAASNFNTLLAQANTATPLPDIT
jgi:hypothetical protein